MEHFCWDDDQIEHIAQHGVSVDEWEDVFVSFESQGTSHSTGLDVRFGYTSAGRYLIVVYEIIILDGESWITPVTGYDVAEPQ